MTQPGSHPSTPSTEAGLAAEPADDDYRAVGDDDELLAVVGMLRGQGLARAVETAAELGIADLVAEGPRSVDDLAETTGSHAPSLYRLLRALAAHGLFAELGARRFAQTPRSATLTSTHPRSLRDVARMFGSEWEWRSWGPFRTASARVGPRSTPPTGCRCGNTSRMSTPRPRPCSTRP